MPKAQGRYTNMSIRAAAAERLVKGINWPMFHKQKLTLIKVLNEKLQGQEEEHLQGILHLLDALQDMAIVVFGIEAADNSQPEEEQS